jgi:chromosomal replication initiator protein
MTSIEQDRWSRVKGRLRSSVGEDVYTSWFARMDLESVHDESVHLSVPTRFLKSWIQAHYAERVLSCWQAELPQVHRVDLNSTRAVPNGRITGPRSSCVRSQPRRFRQTTMRSAARRWIRV